MKPPAAPSAPAPAPARKRGRPPAAGKAKTGAERTALYRSRKLDERFLEDLPFQSRVALVTALSKDLQLIEDYQSGSSSVGPDLAQDLLAGAQVTAGEVVGELIRRYGLVLQKRRPALGSKK